jgi:ABC-type multidrug transport system ATPase subunit
MEIVMTGLNKIYKGNVHALHELNLTIPTGMCGLLGPNGAGKTTLMRILAGILEPTSGVLRIGGYDATTHSGRQNIKRTLGYLPQDLGMYPDMSAYDFLDYIGILKGLHHTPTRRKRIEELLDMVALTQVADRKVGTFSGGMKRRVGIAQAIINDPKLLIVDEPTAGLDPEERIRFRNLLADLAGDRTILLSTHIIEDIAQTCQRIAVMRKGRIIFQGYLTDMIRATQGKAFLITSFGPKPQGDFTIVSTMHLEHAIQYRVVGNLPTIPGAQIEAVAPSLEDSYVWFMSQQNT